MKHKSSNDGPIFIPYDDENLDHVMSGPDYGQVDTGSKSTAWEEIDSSEYDDYVWYITEKIINKKIKVI
jgi:hypothetical protein